jgi:hypothetical protein
MSSMSGLVETGAWESLVRDDEAATFFQTPAWHQLAEDFEGTRTRLLNLGEAAAPILLPVQSVKRWWGELLAAPFGTYATLLSRPGDDDDIRLDAAERALSRLNINLTGSPFASRLPDPNRSADAGAPVSNTRLLRLGALDPEGWVASWSRNHRRLLRDAEERGYVMREARNAGDVSKYFTLYQGQAARWGGAARRVYPEELFQEAFRRFVPDGSMKLWLAEDPQEGIVAGRLCFYHGGHAVEWHAAAERRAMERGVNHKAVHAAVLDARARGFRVYDFNPNPGLEAVDHFKRGFATETVAFNGYRNRTGLAGLLTGLRSGLRATLRKR